MKLERAEILCVGTEILIGDIINTNAAWLSKELSSLGISQYHQAVIGDNSQRLAETVSDTLKNCDLLVITGGLGPTYDDITKETVAKVLNKNLVFDEDVYYDIKDFFRKRERKMTENNRKQAYIIEGAHILKNDMGTAPGLLCETGEKIVVLLPGPPSELMPMWTNYVKPQIQKYCDKIFVSKNVNIVGIGEAAVADVLDEMMKNAVNPTIAPYCKTGETRLRVTASAKTKEEAAAMCDEVIEEIKKTKIGEYIYGIDTDLAEAVVKELTKRGLKIATAESCTGGLIAKMITDVPGSSAVLEGGMVAYSNSVKYRALNVSSSLLDRHGPYDHKVAVQMAEGICRLMDADVGIGVTGIAGPGGGTREKPVGFVYIAVAYNKKSSVMKYKFGEKQSRDRIRELTAANAFINVLEMLKNQK
ncbi:MAG: competence/damage-inducible protein A [Clostridia bacterium]|nr:competence/damage-inducible protein A [Clostridia bacterium]